MSFGKFKEDSSDKNSAAASAVGASVGSSAVTSSQGSQSLSQTKSDAFLGKGTRVVGSLSFNGPVELDGYVEGEVTSKETLTIGESAVVNAKIQGSEIIIRGTVTGDVVAHRKLSLRKPARVTGNIAAPTLSIEDGVHFEGRCSMGTSSSAGEQKGPMSVISGDKRSEKLGAVG